MKKSILLTLVLCTVASYAFAQFAGSSGASWTATPVSQLNPGPNSSFTITFGITGGAQPGQLDGFDLWIVTSSANSGLFTITGATWSSPYTEAGSSATGANDPINVATNGGAFVVNTSDWGNIRNHLQPVSADFTAAYTGQTLMTLTIATGAGVNANATYTLFTSTTGNASNSALGFNRGSDFLDSASSAWSTIATQFSISPVPEPATLSLLALGGLGSLGMVILRRRRG